MISQSNVPERTAKSSQEQAVAAWANYLNQVRLENLTSALRRQDGNLINAFQSLDEAVSEIQKLVASNIGGQKGMHGFIAEVAETGVGNARNQILGEDAIYTWVNDNGPIDLMRDGIGIQQKFYSSGGSFGLNAVSKHLEKYPDFLESGHKYQLPKNHYEMVSKLHAMTPEQAARELSRASGGPSYKQWLRVQSFFQEGSVPFESLEPSHLDYQEVQRNTYGLTLEAEKASLTKTHRAQQDTARQASKPNFKQGAQATVTAAAIEGGTALIMALAQKRRSGTKFNALTVDDWAEIANSAGIGFAKGGVRGFSVYALTNFTVTSAAAASALVTAAFGIAEQANKLRRGVISEQEFIANAELVSIEAAVSALASLIGQAVIPMPVLGAVIGNTIGMVMYQTVSSSLSKREAALVERYAKEQQELDKQLVDEYQTVVEQLDRALSEYLQVLEVAFSPDPRTAMLGSIQLAHELGVDADELLDTDEKISAYFLD